jgi:hypothetical protein
MVEWGSVERSRRRLPALRYSVPVLGAPVLAAAGFALLVVAEFVPWARIQVTGTTLRPGTASDGGLTITLDRVVAAEGFAFQLGAIVLLGGVGYALTCSTARRRVAMGTTIGVAAGQLLLTISIARAALRAFDTLSGLGLSDRTDSTFSVVTGSGVFFAIAGVLLLTAAAVTAGTLYPGARRRPLAAAPASDSPAMAEAAVIGPDGERELTVSPMQPLDESYFARPDQH